MKHENKKFWRKNERDVCKQLGLRPVPGSGAGMEKEDGENDYILCQSLIAVIVDTAQDYGVPVYSVDTRSWKAQIVGKSTHDKNESTKQPTLNYVENTLGYTVADDNEADAICISKYGFLSKTKQKLKKEQQENEVN